MGGGPPPKTRRRPHEPDVCLPEGPPLLSNLQAHARTVQSSCRPGLECLPLPRSPRRRTKGKAQRNVQARAPHKRGCERAPSPPGASSTIAQDAEHVAERHRRSMGPLSNQRCHSHRRAERTEGFRGAPSPYSVVRAGLLKRRALRPGAARWAPPRLRCSWARRPRRLPYRIEHLSHPNLATCWRPARRRRACRSWPSSSRARQALG
jgi:hypothetical protein